MENTGSNRLSTSVWVGPSLLDDHLKIDFNGYFRKYDNETNSGIHYGESLINDLQSFEGNGNPNSNNFMGTLKTDYSLHFFEDLHVNLYHFLQLSPYSSKYNLLYFLRKLCSYTVVHARKKQFHLYL